LVYAVDCRGILVGETFGEKDFDHSFTSGDAVGGAGFARRATDAGHRLQGRKLASRAASPQARQEFAPRETSPRREAAQSDPVITEDAARKLLACRKKNQLLRNRNLATILAQYKMLQDHACAARICAKQSVAKEF
jgi:hypothetical protein